MRPTDKNLITQHPRILAILVSILIAHATTVMASDYRFGFGVNAGYGMLSGGDFQDYDPDLLYGGFFQFKPTSRWELAASYHKIEFDHAGMTTTALVVAGLSDSLAATHKGNRFGLHLNRLLFPSERSINVTMGFGGGVLDWSVSDPIADTVYRVYDKDSLFRDFSATELFLSARTAVSMTLMQHLALEISGEADYLTGAGVSFASELNKNRDRWLFTGLVSLSFSFGHRGEKGTVWQSDKEWADTLSKGNASPVIQPPIQKQMPRKLEGTLDSDGDGITDSDDQCADTRPGAIVDRNGCPVDTDKDGVPDGLDDCQGTIAEARDKVDLFGCPRDADFDGIPDYRDACPFNLIGAHVDDTGCPIDEDQDGIPNGIDDCPGTMFGMTVDSHGCLDISMLQKPMVLHIDYVSGSFEIDPKGKERLRKLSNLLTLVPEIRLEITGYTDNIGTDGANQQLSERRANRVKDFLVANGVTIERMKTFGRGEANPMSSNDTAEGRAKNRRIEIVFFNR